MIYPAWRYHREHGGKIIHSAEEESPAWEDSPASVHLVPYVLNGSMAFEKLPASSYKEHMEEWESKEDKEEKKKPGRPKKEKP